MKHNKLLAIAAVVASMAGPTWAALPDDASNTPNGSNFTGADSSAGTKSRTERMDNQHMKDKNAKRSSKNMAEGDKPVDGGSGSDTMRGAMGTNQGAVGAGSVTGTAGGTRAPTAGKAEMDKSSTGNMGASGSSSSMSNSSGGAADMAAKPTRVDGGSGSDTMRGATGTGQGAIGTGSVTGVPKK